MTSAATRRSSSSTNKRYDEGESDCSSTCSTFNASTVIDINWRSSASFGETSTVIPPRMAKLGVKFDWQASPLRGSEGASLRSAKARGLQLSVSRSDLLKTSVFARPTADHAFNIHHADDHVPLSSILG